MNCISCDLSSDIDQLLAPLAEGQQAIVMAFVLRASVHPFVRACGHKLCLLKTSPQKLLTGFLPNFTGMFLS